MITAQAVPQRGADLVLRPAAVVAPGAGGVLLDTGPIGPNTVYLEVFVNATADANGADPQLVHRDALNAADVEPPESLAAMSGPPQGTVNAPAVAAAELIFFSRARVTLAAGQRLLVRTRLAAAGGESWQARADIWVL